MKFFHFAPDENNSGKPDEENPFARFTARSTGLNQDSSSGKTPAEPPKPNADPYADFRPKPTTPPARQTGTASPSASGQTGTNPGDASGQPASDPFAEFRSHTGDTSFHNTSAPSDDASPNPGAGGQNPNNADPFAGFRPQGFAKDSYRSFDPYSGISPKDRPESNEGRASTSMVLGIISLVTIFLCCGCGGIVSLILGVIALILAVNSKNGIPMNGNARCGQICGIISIILSVVLILFEILIFALAINDPEFREDFDNTIEENTESDSEAQTWVYPPSPLLEADNGSGVYSVCLMEAIPENNP